MKYRLLNNTRKLLVRDVNEAIEQGWVPQGGVTMGGLIGGIVSYAQAMVKEEDEHSVS